MFYFINQEPMPFAFATWQSHYFLVIYFTMVYSENRKCWSGWDTTTTMKKNLID